MRENEASPGRRLIVLTNDQPHPPNYGHKVDQWERWRGFAGRGWRLRLIHWRSPADPPARPGDAAALAGVFERVDVLPIGWNAASFARRLAWLPRWPSQVAARVPDGATRRRLIAEARAFAPAAVVLDNIHGGVLGEALARACGVPAILRGHNVEHRYLAQQARAAAGMGERVRWRIARAGLERYEAALVSRAAWTFDISADDVAHWRARGIERISWAPTVRPGAAAGTILPPAARSHDIAYIGNLRLPNNLAGIAWFVDAVLPLLRMRRPGTTALFAGADPSPQARAILARAPEITLVPDASSADAILSQGRVLVNPILTGSGVNVKSIEMLRYDAPIVTTRVGAHGFGDEVDGQFVVRDDPAGFADAIVAALADPLPPPGRAAARALFGEAGLDRQIALIARVAGIDAP